jgi:hypothetical protein
MPNFDLFGNPLPDPFHPLPLSKKQNPCIRAFGAGPENKRCKHCTHLYRKRWAGVYYKCELRNNTNGQATDHRVNWPACSRFEPSTILQSDDNKQQQKG